MDGRNTNMLSDECQSRQRERMVLYPQDAKQKKMRYVADVAHESGYRLQSLLVAALLEMTIHRWELSKLEEYRAVIQQYPLKHFQKCK